MEDKEKGVSYFGYLSRKDESMNSVLGFRKSRLKVIHNAYV